MERITSHQVVGLMEAYNAVHAPQVNEDYLWESYLTEEFISEAYQTVADYLVHNGFVPGYNTAEVYMSEMSVEDIDSILFETGVLNEQYLIEAGFFQNAANTAIGGVKRAGSAVAGGIRSAAGGADRAVGGAVRAGQTAVGAVKRAGNAVAGGAQRAASAVGSATQRVGQTASGAAQRAGAAVQRTVTPVAQAVKGTAQRAVSAGQSALGSAGRAVQGAAQGAVRGATSAGQAVSGAAQRAGSAVAGAAGAAGRKIGQEIEISRKVGAGEPLNKPTIAAKPAPAAPSSQNTKQNLGGAQYAAFKGGGGDAAIRQGRSAGEVVAQGRKNISKVVSGRELGALKPGLTQSFDIFDVIKGHLIDEGYADTEDAALQIMANMSEEWRESIIEEVLDESRGGDASPGTPESYHKLSRGVKKDKGQKSSYDTEGNMNRKYTTMQLKKRKQAPYND
jgi:hypothetical protein